MLDDLISDPEFVLASDLDRLLLVLDQARTEEGQNIADVIASAATYLGRDTPDGASYLQMIARQYDAAAFGDRVGHRTGHPLPWLNRWAQVMPRTPNRVLGHHDSPATAIASLALPEAGQVAVSGGADGMVRVWNLEPGDPAHESLVRGAPIRSIRPLRHRDGQPGVLVLDEAGTCVWWDLTDSSALPLSLDSHDPCRCLTVLERDGVTTALLGCGSTVVEYDTERNCVVRTFDLASYGTDQPVQISEIAVLPAGEGDGLLVIDLSHNRIAVLELASGVVTGTLVTVDAEDQDRQNKEDQDRQNKEERGKRCLLSVSEMTGRKVALVQGKGDIVFWDLDLRTRLGYAMMPYVYGTGVMADGRPIVLGADNDGTFGAWDLSDLVASCSPQSRAELVEQVSEALRVLPSPDDAAETVSPEQAAQMICEAPASLGLSGPVRAIAALAMGDGRSATAAYAGPSDLRVWPAKTAPSAGGQYLITARGPLPGLSATAYSPHLSMGKDYSQADERLLDTWILPPPAGRGQHLLGHAGSVNAGILPVPLRGSDYAVSAGADGTIRSWRLELGQGVSHGLAELNLQPSALATVSLGEAGPAVITGGVDGQIMAWSLSDGSRVGQPLGGNGYGVQSLAAVRSTDGTVFAGALHNNLTFRLWNLTAGKILSEVHMIEGFVFTEVAGDIAIALRTSGRDTLQVYSVLGGGPCGAPTPLYGRPNDPTVLNMKSPGGCQLILAEKYEDRGQGSEGRYRLRKLDAESGKNGERASAVLGGTNDIIAMATLVSVDGLQCIVLVTGSGVTVWDLGQHRLIADISPWFSPPDILATGRLPDGTSVAVLGHSREQEFCFLDPDHPSPFGLISVDSVIRALGIGEDGTVVVATESGLLAISQSTARIPVPAPTRSLTGTAPNYSRNSGLYVTRETSGGSTTTSIYASTNFAPAFGQISHLVRSAVQAALGSGEVRPQAHDLIGNLLADQDDWAGPEAAADAMAGLAAWVGNWSKAAIGTQTDALGRWEAQPFRCAHGSLLIAERFATVQLALERQDWHLARPVLRTAASGLFIGETEVLPTEVRAGLHLLLARIAVILGEDPSPDLEVAGSMGASPAGAAVVRAWYSRNEGRQAEAAAYLAEARGGGMSPAVVAEAIFQARQASSERGLSAAQEALAGLADMADISSQLGRLAGHVPPELWLAIAERAGQEDQLATAALDKAEREADNDNELRAVICEQRAELLARSDADPCVRADALADAGNYRWSAGQQDVAKQRFQTALDLCPGNVQTALSLVSVDAAVWLAVPVSESAPHLEEVAARLESLQASQGVNADTAWSLMNTAALYERLGSVAQHPSSVHLWRAILAIGRVLAFHPDSPTYWSQLATTLVAADLYQSAAFAAKHAHALDPGRQPHDDVVNALIFTAACLGDYGAVRELLPEDIENSPAWFRAQAGLVQLRLGSKTEAVNLLLSATTDDPSLLWARVALMQGYVLTGDNDLARSEALRTGDSVDARGDLSVLSKCALFGGDLAGAERLASELVQDHNDLQRGDGLDVVGQAKLLMGRREGSDDLAEYLQLARSPGILDDWELCDRPILEALAREHRAGLPDLMPLNDVITRRRATLTGWEDPLAELAQAPTGTTDSVIVGQARLILNVLLSEAAGDLASARSALNAEAAAQAIPEWPRLAERVLRAYADNCLAQGELTEAVAAEEERLAYAPPDESGDRISETAAVLSAAGQHDLARRLIDAARQRAGNLPDLTRAEGDLLWRMGQRDDAAKAWASARAADGDRLEARLAAWMAHSDRSATVGLLRTAITRSYIETAADLRTLPIEASDMPPIIAALEEVASDPQIAPEAIAVIRMLAAPSGKLDVPANALQVYLPPSWFAGMKNPEVESPLVARYLREMRLRMPWKLPGIGIRDDRDLEPDRYRILVLGTIFEEGSVPVDAGYVPEDALPLLSAAAQERVTADQRLGLTVLHGTKEAAAGLDDLLVMPATEVVARRLAAIATAFHSAIMSGGG